MSGKIVESLENLFSSPQGILSIFIQVDGSYPVDHLNLIRCFTAGMQPPVRLILPLPPPAPRVQLCKVPNKILG